MKRKFNKKQITFVLIAICLVGLIGLGVSYSYYLASIRTSNEENKSTDISTLRITSVVMDMQGKISSNGAHHGHKMVKEVVVRGIGVENAKPANASIKITPDLGDFSSDVTWKLYKSDSAITCSSVEHTDGREYYDESTCNIPASASLVLEGSSDSDYFNIVVSPNTETKYYLVVEYANRSDKDQNNQKGKSFSIDIDLGEKEEAPTFANTIAKLARKDTINLASDDPDKNIRYIGKNPDNYVYFNCSDYSNQSADTCEKWRVIGLFNNITKGDGSKENLVKIIRNDSIGQLSWDSSPDIDFNACYGGNNWSKSSLQLLLNSGIYYNGTTGTHYNCRGAYGAGDYYKLQLNFTSTGLKNDTTRNAIEEVVWNTGGIPSSSGSLTSSAFYQYERGTTVYSDNPITWTGKIALIYPSDYGYATAGSTNNDRATCLSTGLTSSDDTLKDCYNSNNNYLFYSDVAYLTTDASSSQLVYQSYSDSRGLINDPSTFAFNTRPALYLKSSFTVKDGDGSENSPYQLNIE